MCAFVPSVWPDEEPGRIKASSLSYCPKILPGLSQHLREKMEKQGRVEKTETQVRRSVFNIKECSFFPENIPHILNIWCIPSVSALRLTCLLCIVERPTQFASPPGNLYIFVQSMVIVLKMTEC